MQNFYIKCFYLLANLCIPYVNPAEKWSKILVGVRVVMFNAIFNNISVISWRSVSLVEATRVPGENHRPAASNWQTLSYSWIEYTSPWAWFKLTMLMVIITHCVGSCVSNFPMITTMNVPASFGKRSILK